MKKTTLLLTMVLALCGSAMAGASVAWPLTQPSGTSGPIFMGMNTSTYAYDGTVLTVAQPNYPSIPAALTYFSPAAVGLGDDYVLSATIDFDANNSELGLLARANTATNAFYELSLNPINSYFIINSIAGLVPTKLAGISLAGQIDTSKTYKLVFQVEGTQLDGYLFDDANNEISHLTATNSVYTTGSVGAFTFAPSGSAGVTGTYLNPTIGAIPEPATMSLLAVGGVLALIRRRK